MNRISQFFSKVKDKLFGKKSVAPVVSHIPAPKPKQVKLSFRKSRRLRRLSKSHALRDAHFGTFSPIRPVGRGANRTRVSGKTMTRAFKDAFFYEYGWRLR